MFSNERWETPICFGSGFQFPAQLVARPVQPDIIDCFLVSTLIRPLIHKYEVVQSVPWRPHNGVRITLNIDFESCRGSSWEKPANEETTARMQSHVGQEPNQTEEADPTLWDEARRQCVFDGKKPRCQNGQEDAKAACSQHASAVGSQEEADELDHALETWSDTTTQYWVSF